jgi:hypothetical protein
MKQAVAPSTQEREASTEKTNQANKKTPKTKNSLKVNE